MGEIAKRLTVFAGISLLLCFCLSGCFMKSGNELYAVPRHLDEQAGLDSAVSSLLSENRGFCAPVEGENRQTVQFADLDGDGSDEAIAFLKEKDSSVPLQAHILNRPDGFYRDCCVVGGDGADFQSAAYIQLDEKPGLELLLTRHVSSSLPALLNVYSFRDGAIHDLLSEAGAEYTAADLDADGAQELLLFYTRGTEQKKAVLYKRSEGELFPDQTVLLSEDLPADVKIQTADLAWGLPAVFVSGQCPDGSVLTDVLVLWNGELINLNRSDMDIGDITRCLGDFFPTDVDSDGIMELPKRIALPGEETADNFLLLWYSIGLDGAVTEKLRTYQNSSAGWYLVIPERWGEQLTVQTDSDGSVCFAQWRQNDAPIPIFTIYTFSGEGRNAHGVSDGRFILSEKGSVTYSASFGTSTWAGLLTQEQMKQMFNFIHSDWITSET